MSGRLTILPKKSYCPWNSENVERVLRDERLERERLEKEAKETRAAGNERRGRQRRKGGDHDPTATTENGHINLFPEAKEAELKLARGQSQNNSEDGNNANTGDVLPIPLGGDEATKRKLPFYMRSKINNISDEAKYENTSGSFRLGDNRGNGRGGAAATADEITSKIMEDQYERREDGRKKKMDPMTRFIHSSNASSGKMVSSLKCSNSSRKVTYGSKRTHLDMEDHKSTDKKHRMKRHKKKSRRDEDDSVDSDSSTSYSSSSFSSSSSLCASVSSDKANSRHYKRRNSRKGEKHNSHRRRRRSRSEERSRTKSKRKHGKESKQMHHHRRHKDRLTNLDNSQTKAEENELEELRKRRRTREAREAERERQVLKPQKGSTREAGSYSVSSSYQDQFNPMLSRN